MGLALRYQGQDIPTPVEFGTVAPNTAFLKCEVVMPVGTRLSLHAGDMEIPVFVIRAIDEGSGAGIYVRADLHDKNKKWWADHVKVEQDFRFPEISGDEGGIPEPTNGPSETTKRSTMTMGAVDIEDVLEQQPPDADQPPAGAAAETMEDIPESKNDSGSKKKRRKKKKRRR